ncbi:unnamed protein product, partial [Cladocopium goreaui]
RWHVCADQLRTQKNARCGIRETRGAHHGRSPHGGGGLGAGSADCLKARSDGFRKSHLPLRRD